MQIIFLLLQLGMDILGLILRRNVGHKVLLLKTLNINVFNEL